MFSEVEQESISSREKKVLSFWEEENVFLRSVEKREKEKAECFSFYDGPPFATGLPHYGHLLAGTIKDVIPRYKTMKGYYVPRRFGWDSHGLPVEQEVEKEQGLSGAKSVQEFGIAKFNEACRSIVLRYSKEWETTVKRMGRWVDFSRTYLTMDKTFMESVWWVFKQIFDKGLVYEGFKVMPYSAKLGTGLSNSEAGENYKDVDDPSLVVEFSLEESEDILLAWTTTPWTLVSNLALGVHPESTYVRVKSKKNQKTYILAKERYLSHFAEEEVELLSSFLGKELDQKAYKPLFSYFKEEREKGSFVVLAAEYVGTDEGTGVVHMAPAFGEEDFFACKNRGIELVCPVDDNGKFTKEVPEYEGLFVKDADKGIIRTLKEKNKLFSQATVRHRYPYCWRSDTPLIYKAVRSWYIAVEQLKDRLVELNEQVHWTPSHIKSNRFGNWLRGARDWSFSRTRYWGTPVPIWRSEDGDIHVVGSIEELESLTGEKINDLHKHFIDDLSFEKDGKVYHRITEVFDCWFESGSMPYAQNHYPFENKEFIHKTHPADFIAEGVDQTRGWFYTLMVISGILFDKPAFKNVIVNGIILAEDGAKMSKRLKNYPDPEGLIERFGADAVRLYMLHSPAVKADDLRFSEKGVELVVRQIMIPWWNAYSFFVTYANIYSWEFDPKWKKPQGQMDAWILSKLHGLIDQVESSLDHYDLNASVEPFVDFIDQLTNWYIRTSRRRFYAEEDSQDRKDAFHTLYMVLIELSKLAAPFVPFITESIYRNLRQKDMLESVHLCDFPCYSSERRDEELEQVVEVVQKAVSLGHFLRKQQKVKVRQPLPKLEVICSEKALLERLKTFSPLIADELNVKEVHFSSDESAYVRLVVKPNFRILGKKVGKRMRAVQERIHNLSAEERKEWEVKKELTIEVEGEAIHLVEEDLSIEREVKEGGVAANEGSVTVLLDTQLTEALIREGLVREIRNKISAIRRDKAFKVTDRIHVTLETTEPVKQAIEEFRDFLQEEVLALSLKYDCCEGEVWDINGEPTKIAVEKAEL